MLIAFVEKLVIPYLLGITTPIVAMQQSVQINQQDLITLPLEAVLTHATLRITGTGLLAWNANRVRKDKSNRTVEVHQQERAFRVTFLQMHTSLLDATMLTVLAVE